MAVRVSHGAKPIGLFVIADVSRIAVRCTTHKHSDDPGGWTRLGVGEVESIGKKGHAEGCKKGQAPQGSMEDSP